MFGYLAKTLVSTQAHHFKTIPLNMMKRSIGSLSNTSFIIDSMRRDYQEVKFICKTSHLQIREFHSSSPLFKQFILPDIGEGLLKMINLLITLYHV